MMKQAIYFSLPVVARNVAVTTIGWQKNRRRFAGDFARWRKYFAENATRSAGNIKDEQFETLQVWLREACARTPYYESILGGSSKTLAPRLRSWDDLARLPVLPKEKVKEAPEAFLVRGAGTRGLVWHLTSGSTGSPMRVPYYPENEQFELGLIWGRARPGVTRGQRHVSFTGQPVCDPKSNVPPFWIDDWFSRQRLCSIYHLSAANCSYYGDAIEQFQPEYITGYNNAVAFLASGLLDLGRPLATHPRAFFAGSEKLLPSNRRIIEQELKCRVWNHYGQAELACSITEYHCGRLHLDLDYSYVEFEPIETDQEGNVTAELVATNLHNHKWPLLRYRTGDLVTYHPDERCPCGHPGRVIKEIAGRTNQFINLKDGRKLFNLTTTLRLVQGIRTAQAKKIADGEIELMFVRDRDAPGDVAGQIVRVFRDRFGSNLEVCPREVHEIVRTRRGKFMTIVD
jgi:phenylacetate-CoA ligase